MAPIHTDMDSLTDYYIHQAGGGGGLQDDLFGTLYVDSPNV